MQKHYPKFEKRQNQDRSYTDMSQSSGREGVVMAYNEFKNTASVLMSLPKSEGFGAILEDVPCPTIMGVQTVAPEPGRMCWVAFKDSNERKPIITHYYNHAYFKYDYGIQRNANNLVPNFYSYM